MTSMAWRLRLTTLLAVGALSVHELRYLLAFGRHGERAAADQGHAYLSILTPVIAVVAALAAVQLLFWLACRSGVEVAAPRFGRLWVTASVVLIAAYSIQEWAEGTLVSGHAAGVGGLVAHGGWIAFVLAVAVGALIALTVRGVAAASRRCNPRAWFASAQPIPRSVSLLAWRRSRVEVLACHLASRAPPPTSA